MSSESAQDNEATFAICFFTLEFSAYPKKWAVFRDVQGEPVGSGPRRIVHVVDAVAETQGGLVPCFPGSEAGDGPGQAVARNAEAGEIPLQDKIPLRIEVKGAAGTDDRFQPVPVSEPLPIVGKR